MSAGGARSELSGLPSPSGSALATPASSRHMLRFSQDGLGTTSRLVAPSSQPTPLTGRPELGYYVGFRPSQGSQRAGGAALSVSGWWAAVERLQLVLAL